MVITQAQLSRAVPEVNRARLNEFVASFNMWAAHFGIDTPLRAAHYLSQVFHESGYLKAVEENLNYSADGLLRTFPRYFNATTANQYARQPEKIANKVYANRMGNGSEASGDGWRYRGRGYIGLTGKSNYADFKRYDLCTADVVNHPEKVAEYPLNQLCAMWFWEKYKLNVEADKDNGLNYSEVCKTITKKINGGTNGLANRQFLLRRFKKEFGIK